MAELAALLSGLCAAIVVLRITQSPAGEPVIAGVEGSLRHLKGTASRWRALVERADGEGGAGDRAVHRRLRAPAAAAAGALGYSIGGALLAIAAAVAAWPLLTAVLRARRRGYARRVDAGAAELALALASALAAGHSVRGALLASGGSLPSPLAGEMRRVAVDITLGRTVEEALAALRCRTSSPRLESLTGAIELHRRCGGDLVLLMRELAGAFRARDLAHRDARAATAQARFTAGIVAAMPLVAGLLAELASPGSVSGAFSFAPAALMMLFACALLLAGVALCLRTARV